MAPKLSERHKEAGIVRFTSTEANTNHSWTAVVNLAKVKLGGETNPRIPTNRHIAEIRENFSVYCSDNPKLWYQGGTLSSINGSHTMKVMILEGYKTMTCNVWLNLTEQQSLEIFYEGNMKSKKMNSWTAFGVALRAKYKWATTIQRRLKAAGFTTPADRGYNQNTASIRSIIGLIEAYEAGSTVLRDVVNILSVWQDEEVRDSGKNPIGCCPFIRGVLDLVRQYREFCPEQMAETLSARDAWDIDRKATLCAGRRPERGHYFMVLDKLYNRPWLATAA
jgi:hypothetical protein